MHYTKYRRVGLILVALSLVVFASGCASTKESANGDPLESTNRFMYKINDTVDKYALEPVAKGYEKVTPRMLRDGFTNFFDNLSVLNVVLNDMLQGKFQQGVADTGRFIVNSTFGIGGFIDPASTWGLTKHQEDMGQTLGVWGAGEGAYLVIPFIGPNSLRDAPDLLTSIPLNPLFYVTSPWLIPVGVIGLVNQRANLLDATRIRDEAALDPYTFTREAYRQKRTSDIYDGNPPTEDIDQDLELEDEPGGENKGDKNNSGKTNKDKKDDKI